jgi:hypothetical protein
MRTFNVIKRNDWRLIFFYQGCLGIIVEYMV